MKIKKINRRQSPLKFVMNIVFNYEYSIPNCVKYYTRNRDKLMIIASRSTEMAEESTIPI